MDVLQKDDGGLAEENAKQHVEVALVAAPGNPKGCPYSPKYQYER